MPAYRSGHSYFQLCLKCCQFFNSIHFPNRSSIIPPFDLFLLTKSKNERIVEKWKDSRDQRILTEPTAWRSLCRCNNRTPVDLLSLRSSMIRFPSIIDIIWILKWRERMRSSNMYFLLSSFVNIKNIVDERNRMNDLEFCRSFIKADLPLWLFECWKILTQKKNSGKRRKECKTPTKIEGGSAATDLVIFIRPHKLEKITRRNLFQKL